MVLIESSWLRRAAAGVVALTCTVASAQTAPKPTKAAPAKPAEGKTLSLGGNATGDSRLLTREELRQCLKRQDALALRREEVDKQRDPLTLEKEALVKEQDAMKADRARMDALRESVKNLNARFAAYSERVNVFNERSKAVQEKGGRAADRERDALQAERDELQKLQTTLEADRTQLIASTQQDVDAFNARATALDAKAADWNQRNSALVEAARAVNQERDSWLTECGNRRYREDDELAIRKGQ